MQFKHPEILYALLLLLIPIIIHLFQLRRFQKVDFTNVAFLKKATLQTRKSSQLKKWLTLLTRLLAIACLVFAFAQPFTASKTALNTEKETVIYIDNSFSMQAKGPEGPMLSRTLQQLYDELSGDERISWFTNNNAKGQVTQNDFKQEVLSLPYTDLQLEPQSVLLKAEQFFSKSVSADRRLIWISDFQNKGTQIPEASNFAIDVIQTHPVSNANIAIDSAYVIEKNKEGLQLGVTLSGTGTLPENTAVSVYNRNKLIAKTGVNLSQNTHTISFNLEDPDGFQGEIRISDPQLQYDNTLFFSINKDKPLQILAINQGDGAFLRKLFDHENYEFTEQSFNSLNFNIIPQQHFIILNELESIPAALSNALEVFQKEGGGLFIIPTQNGDIASYNSLLNELQFGAFHSVVTSVSKKITQINFDHPLYQNVFEKRVTNFQYPSVNTYYDINTNATGVLRFEDGKPFILQQGNVYVATAALDRENSNFKNSPLIVPTLINMVQQSIPLPKLYYSLSQPHTIALPVSLHQDQIITLKDSTETFIPLQQTKANTVEITTTPELDRATNYDALSEDVVLQTLSFNYPRSESVLRYHDLSEWQGVTTHDSVSDLFNSLAEANQVNSLWKWFIIFAVLFLLFEMFILKFL